MPPASPIPRTARRSAVAALASLALLASGCGLVGGDDPEPTLAPGELQTRPVLDGAVTRYEALLDEARDVLAGMLPNAELVETSDGERTACAGKMEAEGLPERTSRYRLPTWEADARPTDAQWERLTAGLEGALWEHSFARVDDAGSAGASGGDGARRLVARDDLGAELELRSDDVVSLSLTTGCHLEER